MYRSDEKNEYKNGKRNKEEVQESGRRVPISIWREIRPKNNPPQPTHPHNRLATKALLMARQSSDIAYPSLNLTRLAFGSCHSRAVNRRLAKSRADSNANNSTIWDVINSTIQPQTFLWAGDAIYPPMKIKGDTPVNVMQDEYHQMLTNDTLGYSKFVRDGHLTGGVHGVWDDHDYGGNDRGRELKQREERRNAYLDFLGVPGTSSRRQRDGLYSSVEFGSDEHNNTVKVIFLDTRWHREKHCIPSVGSNPYVPFGAIVACLTRWFTAGFNLPSHLPSSLCPSNKDNAVLGKEQWMWLERQLEESSASVHIVVSSIQVLTTNPVVESWGHFPEERAKLLKLLNNVPGLVILSGDVHHGEISTTSIQNDHAMNSIASKHRAIIEVTSSGLSHSCDGPKIYGPLCQPILNLFTLHRFEGGNLKDISAPSYYTGLNFGSIDFDWAIRSFQVRIHDEYGKLILSTGCLSMDSCADMTPYQLESVAKCIDGHFLLAAKKIISSPMYIIACLMTVFCLCFYLKISSLKMTKDDSKKTK